MGKVFIIAEAGVNHNGNFELAKKLIDSASFSGADAIKFQTFKAESLASNIAQKAEYQKYLSNGQESQLEMLKKLQLSYEVQKELKEYCSKKNIMFLSSPFDSESIDFLNKLGLKIFKIPSGEITNLPYLRKIGSLKKKIIMSTGMANIKEIKDAIDVLVKAGTAKKNITIMHCNTAYPTPCEDVNLNAISTIRDHIKIAVGYSDHSLGIEVPIAAVSLGAKVIEKHFTLDKTLEGPDHRASLEPREFKIMVEAIRNIEKALGDGIKKPSRSEINNLKVVRKSIVAVKDIKKGEVFSTANITTKRPAIGINPMNWDKVIGKKAKRNFGKDEIIEL